jgi:hypothetical protein
LVENTSYFALRRGSGVVADEWWSTVRWRADVPAGVVPIAAGRARVELSQDEAVEALEWAERLDGTAALAVYPHDPRPVVGTST